jgi:1,4-alpha-glucan branching enzyme
MPKSSSKGGKRVKFAIQAAPDSEVYVAGSFNAWDAKKNRMKYKDGTWSTTLVLPPGRHEYKFVVNEVWCVDPGCTEWAPNSFGSLNSVVMVG